MYLPRHFEETRTPVLHELIRTHPFGTLVTMSAGGMVANPLPFELDPAPQPNGTLLAHVARANPVWKDVQADSEVLVIFQGPQTYVSPAWYPGKQEGGKVVPTWNYAVVQARGRLRAIEDRAWLHAFVTRLTNRHEAGRPDPWKVSDAPADYVQKMLEAIVGIEIPVSSLAGKWKVSQNRSREDRDGVFAGLDARGTDAAREMAVLVRKAMP
jgi:transcriptional regulator